MIATPPLFSSELHPCVCAHMTFFYGVKAAI